jgi:hypothetical protein
VLAAAVLTAALGVAGVAAVWSSRSGGGSRAGTTSPPAAEVRTFVDGVEAVLAHSAAGRFDVGTAIADGRSCSIPPAQAAERIASAAAGRQRALAELARVRAPTPAAGQALAALQESLRRSLTADDRYRSYFGGLPAGARCPLPSNAQLRAAASADRAATDAKARFATAFNPLASLSGRRLWSPGEF